MTISDCIIAQLPSSNKYYKSVKCESNFYTEGYINYIMIDQEEISNSFLVFVVAKGRISEFVKVSFLKTFFKEYIHPHDIFFLFFYF